MADLTINHDNRLRQMDYVEVIERMAELRPEPIICSHFGCGRELTMTEKLYGDKCINHSNQIVEIIENKVA